MVLLSFLVRTKNRTKALRLSESVVRSFCMNLDWESESLISSFYHMTTAGFAPSGFIGGGLCMFCLVSFDLVEKLMLTSAYACEESWCCCFLYSECQELENNCKGRLS